MDRPPEGQSTADLRRVFAQHQRANRGGPGCIYVNCWHEGEQESMALWKGYGDGPYGVAVRTTFGTLRQALPRRFSGEDPEDVLVARVRYIDHSSATERIPNEGNVYAPFLCKSVAYTHEHEVRAVFARFAQMDQPGPPGHFVPAPLQGLVGEVRVSPLSPD